MPRTGALRVYLGCEAGSLVSQNVCPTRGPLLLFIVVLLHA